MSEFSEQAALFGCAAQYVGRYPALALLFHVPNGEKRDPATAGKLRAMGVKAGVPDVCLPVARHGAHGLFVEIKIPGGVSSPAQLAWHGYLAREGYRVVVAVGWAQAWLAICRYLDIPYEIVG